MSDDAPQIKLVLAVSDPDTTAELHRFTDEAQRADYALAALRIGVLAMRQVRGELDAKTIRDEGEAILKRIDQALTAYEKSVETKMAATLASYFDPTKGEFSRRVKQLTEDGGEIERVMLAQVSGDSSALGRTLSEAVGQASPLMRMLNPKATDGIVEQLRATAEAVNAQNREQIIGQFDLNDPNSALSKFVAKAQAQSQTVEEALGTKVNDLARMLSLDVGDSAMSRLKQILLDTLKASEQGNAEFRQSVLDVLTEFTTRKAAAEKSTLHGLDFEDAVVGAVIDFANEHNDVPEATGTTTGAIRNCKVGDVVVTVGREYAAEGARFVVEAKEAANYDLAKALEEMDLALKNRRASSGVFVSSTATSQPSIPALRRQGNVVVVRWHQDAPETLPYLYAALSIARAIASTDGQGAIGDADIDDLDKCVRVIEKKINHLDAIMTSAKTVESSARKIWGDADVLKNDLVDQVGKLDAWQQVCRAAL